MSCCILTAIPFAIRTKIGGNSFFFFFFLNVLPKLKIKKKKKRFGNGVQNVVVFWDETTPTFFLTHDDVDVFLFCFSYLHHREPGSSLEWWT